MRSAQHVQVLKVRRASIASRVAIGRLTRGQIRHAARRIPVAKRVDDPGGLGEELAQRAVAGDGHDQRSEQVQAGDDEDGPREHGDAVRELAGRHARRTIVRAAHDPTK